MLDEATYVYGVSLELLVSSGVEAGLNNPTVALRVVGDDKGEQCLGL
jgi:hypothetical protein